MTRLNRAEMDRIAERYRDVVDPGPAARLRAAALWLSVGLYILFCGWLFSIPQVLGGANWSIAGTYLADWVTWESRPDIAIGKDSLLRVDFPSNDPLGDNPSPDWLKAEFRTITLAAAPVSATPALPAAKASSGFVVQPTPKPVAEADTGTQVAKTERVTEAVTIAFSADARIEATAGRIVVTRGSDEIVIPLDGSGVMRFAGPLPDWAKQRKPGEKIVVSFGFPGWAEIEPDRIRIRVRSFGWVNFFFDTDSAFFGKSTAEVFALVMSDTELKPGTSNLSLAINDILYNPSWQHLDVWIKLLQTVVMAFVGTVLATIIAFPLAFIAARNITRNMVVNQVTKRLFDFLRSVDMLIWALFFTRAFGPGPLAGMSAIFFTDTGTLGKLYAEALENIDQKQPEGVKSVGASPVAINRFGVLPQVLPVFMSQALYFWESNTRSATIIGAVGAGGIGLKLWEAIRTNSDWENVAYMVLLILIVVYIFDSLSNAIRIRLIGRSMGGEA